MGTMHGKAFHAVVRLMGIHKLEHEGMHGGPGVGTLISSEQDSLANNCQIYLNQA